MTLVSLRPTMSRPTVAKITNFAPKPIASPKRAFCCKSQVHSQGMIYGYARVSTDGQSVTAQVAKLKAAGCEKAFREVASGAKTNRNQASPGAGATGSWRHAHGHPVGSVGPFNPRPPQHLGRDYNISHSTISRLFP
jgi:hypothetical protein